MSSQLGKRFIDVLKQANNQYGFSVNIKHRPQEHQIPELKRLLERDLLKRKRRTSGSGHQMKRTYSYIREAVRTPRKITYGPMAGMTITDVHFVHTNVQNRTELLKKSGKHCTYYELTPKGIKMLSEHGIKHWSLI